jgi:predicted nuclease of predicted toxin-antitoxin system
MPTLPFDQNLSPRLVSRLADLLPGAQHVAQIGLDRASDLDVWEYARTHECIIVTKDADFNDLSGCQQTVRLIWTQPFTRVDTYAIMAANRLTGHSFCAVDEQSLSG